MFSDDGFQNKIVQCVIRNKDENRMEFTLKANGFIEIDVEIIIDEEQQIDAFETF